MISTRRLLISAGIVSLALAMPRRGNSAAIIFQRRAVPNQGGERQHKSELGINRRVSAGGRHARTQIEEFCAASLDGLLHRLANAGRKGGAWRNVGEQRGDRTARSHGDSAATGAMAADGQHAADDTVAVDPMASAILTREALATARGRHPDSDNAALAVAKSDDRDNMPTVAAGSILGDDQTSVSFSGSEIFQGIRVCLPANQLAVVVQRALAQVPESPALQQLSKNLAQHVKRLSTADGVVVLETLIDQTPGWDPDTSWGVGYLRPEGTLWSLTAALEDYAGYRNELRQVSAPAPHSNGSTANEHRPGSRDSSSRTDDRRAADTGETVPRNTARSKTLH